MIAPPALPLPTFTYEQQQFNQHNNVLRIFFNQVASALNNLNAVYAVGELPSAALAGVGARTFVSDANATTFASIVASGGSNKVPIYSDGTNWRIG